MTRRTKWLLVGGGVGLTLLVIAISRRAQRRTRRRNAVVFEEEIRSPDGDAIYGRVEAFEEEQRWLTMIGRANEELTEAHILVRSWDSEDEALDHVREALGVVEEGTSNGEAA